MRDRITPADAGKTFRKWQRLSSGQDHPRGCGENIFSLPVSSFRTGSPPRMRGKQNGKHITMWSLRITPADAGKTAEVQAEVTWEEDHPRGCGENRRRERGEGVYLGSPPRMRGKLYRPA